MIRRLHGKGDDKRLHDGNHMMRGLYGKENYMMRRLYDERTT